MQVLGDLRVVSYWIDTLVLKNRGKYLCYFTTSPFPLQGKTNAVLKRWQEGFLAPLPGSLKSTGREDGLIIYHGVTFKVELESSEDFTPADGGATV